MKPTYVSLRLCVVAIVAAVAFAIASPARAGAWTAPLGRSYHKVSVSYFGADSEFDVRHEERPFELEGKFTDTTVSYYGEYGIVDRLTVFGTLPLKQIHYANLFEEGTTSGVADVELGLRLRLAVRGPFVLSLHGLVKVPGGYDGSDRLPLGNDQVDGELRFLAGTSALKGRLYFGGEAAYRYRGQAPSDEWRFLFEIGGTFTQSFYGRLKLDEVRSAENQDTVLDVFGNPLAQLSSELRRAEFTLGVQFSKHVSGEASWAPIYYGTSIAKGATYSLAVVWAF